MRPSVLWNIQARARGRVAMYIIKHEDFSYYNYVFYITTTPYLPLKYKPEGTVWLLLHGYNLDNKINTVYNSGTFVCPSSPFSLAWHKRGYLRTGTPSVHWPSCTWTFGTPVHGKQYNMNCTLCQWPLSVQGPRSQLSVKAIGDQMLLYCTLYVYAQCHAPPTFISPPS